MFSGERVLTGLVGVCVCADTCVYVCVLECPVEK